MKKIGAIILVYISMCNITIAQKNASDTASFNLLEELVVTSARKETDPNKVTVPISVIQSKAIRQAGNLRLKDLLQEQTGLFITAGFGAGVQMQGLNPDYTLILLNGEPLIGRTAGVLDLNRFSIQSIKKIEIVKGPSSSLYGSEAMGGVINIITDLQPKNKGNFSVRYGFGNPNREISAPIGAGVFKNSDISASIHQQWKQTHATFSANAYYLDGISFRPFSTVREAQPIWRHTQQFSLTHPFSSKTKFSLTFRNSLDVLKQSFRVVNNGEVSNTFGKEQTQDININPIIRHRFNANVNSTLRLYASLFRGYQELRFSQKPDSVYLDDFKQRFFRAENQTDWQLNKHVLSFGGGYLIDEAASTRYDNIQNVKRNPVGYLFLQDEWSAHKKLTMNIGMRYDHHALFSSAFSPKFSLRYNVNDKFSFLGSIGRGFKAPDFRQMYLNFTNISAGGYSVLGSVDAQRIINQLQINGQIASINQAEFSRLTALTPEFSTGINFGIQWKPLGTWNVKVNAFRNDIQGLIDYRQIATKINGGQIFSYINIENAYTQGIELEFQGRLHARLMVSGGYQWLNTADKEEKDRIKAGQVYTRNENGEISRLRWEQYVGLSNRSTHMAQIKCTYEKSNGLFATLRANYRSGWYVADIDGNGLYNIGDQMAQGFVLFNASVGKPINTHWDWLAGIDNILNYRDDLNLPNQQGRMLFGTIRYQF
jgi:outer membrane receptor for ferrienterochelin and colicins